MQEVLEEARGTERDYHGNRGNRAEVRQRSADHTRGVPPADAESGSSHVGTAIGDLPERRGAARAQSRFSRKTEGQCGTRSGKELARGIGILSSTCERAFKSASAVTLEFLNRVGIRGRGPLDGGRRQDLPGVGKDAARFRELLHAPRRRQFVTAKFGEGERAPSHLPQGFSNGEHGFAKDEPEFLFNGNASLINSILCSGMKD